MTIVQALHDGLKEDMEKTQKELQRGLSPFGEISMRCLVEEMRGIIQAHFTEQLTAAEAPS